MSALLLVLVVLPAVAGALLCLGGVSGDRVGRPVERAAAPAGVLVAALVLALVLGLAPAAGSVSTRLAFVADGSFGLALDPLSRLTAALVAAVTLLVLVFSAGDVTASRARFGGLVLLFEAAVLVTATATTLPALLLGWEVMGATSYALIGFSWREPERVSSGAVAFLTTRTADLGLYAAAGAALAGGAGLDLAGLPQLGPAWRSVAAAGVLVAALGKAAQLPFSAWLSRAMQGPSPVSALLHSAAMVAMGGYLLLREAPLLAAAGWAGPLTAWIGAATALLLGAVAVVQRDLKQLLAASTSAQLGFVVLAAGVGAVGGGAAQLVAHAAVKALLFLCAGAWLSALGTKQLTALRGAARRWPLVGVTASVGALALAGVPPLGLWATKDAVLAAARESSPLLYAAGLAAAVLSAAYAARVVLVVWAPLPADPEAGYDTEQRGTREVGLLERVPLVVLAAGAAGLGVLVAPALSRVLPGGPVGVGVGELALSGGLAVVTVLAVAGLTARGGAARGAAPRVLLDWLLLERATRTLVVRPVLALACALDRADRRFGHDVDATAAAVLALARAVDPADRRLGRGVDSSATATVTSARFLGRLDVSAVDGAVRAVVRGVAGLGALARRTQTGQLHQYYAQAAVALAAALGLLLLLLAGR